MYRLRNAATGVVRTAIYNGHETYEIDSNSRVAEIQPGFDFDRFEFCPLPGVGLPYEPLFRESVPFAHPSEQQWSHCMAPYLKTEKMLVDKSLYNSQDHNRDYGFFWYADRAATVRSNLMTSPAAVVSVPESGVQRVLWYDTFDSEPLSLGSLWEYYGRKRFEGVWLATTIKMRRYITPTVTGANLLFKRATYHLVSATAGPPETNAYDSVTYLPAHANIADETGPTPRAFLYEPGKGPLLVQRLNGLKQQ